MHKGNKEEHKKFSQDKTDEILASFTADFDLAFTAEYDNRIDMIDDLEFAALKQWPEDVARERDGRPMLTLDKIGQAVRKVVGGIRQNMPSIKIDPIDDGADKDTADVLEDLTRQIEQSSKAKNAYLTAAASQVKCGYGVWRITTKINQNDIFEQDIIILPVKNPFTYYFDPDAIMPQKQDGRFMIVSENISQKKFKELFGKKAANRPVGLPSVGIGENRERWYSEDSIRIGEYFVKSKKKKTILQLSNGVVVNADEVTEQDIELYREQGVQPVKEREVEADVINWYKLTAFEILEHQEWPSRFFPGIPVYGEEENLEGETIYRGIVRAAKDPQRMYNYWVSAAAETVALQPKAPYLLTETQIAGHEKFWNSASTANFPWLPYNPDPLAPGPPQRQMPPAMQNGLLQQAEVAAKDVQQATGVFEASVGDLPEQRSGRAVLALQQEANMGTGLYEHNLGDAIEHSAKVIIDLIPKYYDTERVIRLRGEDDSVRFVEINKPMLTPDGMRIQNDLTRGKYDVRTNIGPSFKTRRIEAASSMVELAKVFPQILEVAGDLVASNLDWPGADKLAARLKKLIPPGIIEDDEDDEQAQAQKQAQEQAAQQQQMAVELEFGEKKATIENIQADTANKKATSVKNLTEAQQNDFENSIQVAELAAEQGNVELMKRALSEVVSLMSSSAGSPSAPTANLGVQ